LGERLAGSQKVTGSSPVGSIIITIIIIIIIIRLSNRSLALDRRLVS
jgi:hypothetical protein